MKLQTQLNLKKQERNPIDYNSKILLLGSCFSENIGDKFNYFKFQSTTNPFGILFHPKAIEKLISRAVDKKKYSEKDIFFHNEQWHCFDAHSKLSNTSKQVLLNTLNSNLEITNQQIKQASHIIITLGTAWVYSLLDEDRIVANCHKVPQKLFIKKILSVADIVSSIKNIKELINQKNKNATIIFTVSPVRHLKDGFVENTQSKAHLITAIQEVLDQGTLYFPSFEIMMDELRDYRFYKTDMLHPNELAIQYLWKKFINTWFTINTVKTMQEVETVQKGLSHKSFNQNTQAHQNFLKDLELKKNSLIKNFNHIQF